MLTPTVDFSMQSKPALAPGCRLREVEGEQPSLQIPESMIRMSRTGLEIIRLCDGQRSMLELLAHLNSKYPIELHERIEQEAVDYLKQLSLRGVVKFL